MGKMSKAASVRFFVTLFGLIILVVCLVPVTCVEEVIRASFTVNPGTKYGPPDVGTNYHTRVFGKSVLRGEVTAEGEGIYLTVYGYNARNLENLYVKGRYSFMLDSADDLYTFIFSNTEGHDASLVRFKLEEVWNRPLGISSPLFLITGLVGAALFLTGLVALVVSRLREYLAVSIRTFSDYEEDTVF